MTGKVRSIKKFGSTEKLEYVFDELGMVNNNHENIVEMGSFYSSTSLVI